MNTANLQSSAHALPDASLVGEVDTAGTELLSAFTELFLQYQNQLFGLAYSYLRNAEDAHDVVQDVYLRAFKKMDQLKDDASFGSWIKRITVNTAINSFSRKKREHVFSNLLGDDGEGLNQDEMIGAKNDPVESTICAEQHLVAREMLGLLRAKDQQILTDFYIDGLSQTEISSKRLKPLGTVKKQLHVARNRLQDLLIRHYPQHSFDIQERFIEALGAGRNL